MPVRLLTEPKEAARVNEGGTTVVAPLNSTKHVRWIWHETATPTARGIVLQIISEILTIRTRNIISSKSLRGA